MSFEEPDCSELPPVLEDLFSSNELHELLTLLHSGFPSPSPSGSETSQNGLFLAHYSRLTSGSETTGRSVYTAEERKRRRKASNRESAKRSRLRKKQQLEDHTKEINQLNQENRDLKNELRVLRHQYDALRRDSIGLMAESVDLQYKLAGLHQILANMQL